MLSPVSLGIGMGPREGDCYHELPRIPVPRLSEKGASDALSVDLAGIRRPKWAEKHRFGCP